MSAVYEVFTKISMQDNVSSVLAVVAKKVVGLDASIVKLQGSLTSLNKVSLAVYGSLAAIGGTAILTGLKNIANHGDKLLDQQFQMRSLGIAQNDILKLQAQYYREVARAVPTSTVDEYLKTVRELRAVTGGDAAGLAAAAKMAPTAMMMNTILGNTMGTQRADEYYKLLRSAEMKGIATDETKREAFIGDSFRYILGFGGKLKADDIQVLARRAGAAFVNMKPEAMGPLMVNAADLGGSGAGTAFMTLHQYQTGAHVLSKQQKETMQAAGLIDMSKVVPSGFGSGKWNLGPGAMVGANEYAGDLPGWIKNVVYPKLKALAAKQGKGVDAVMGESFPELDALVSKVAPNRNAAKDILMFGEKGFLDQTSKDMGIAGMVQKLAESYPDFFKNDPKGTKMAFGMQYESMMESIGAPMMQAALPVMSAVTSMFTSLGEFANKYPTAMTALGGGIAALAAVLVGAGGIALLGAIGVSGWLVAGITALGAAVTAFVATDSWGKIKAIFTNLPTIARDGFSKFTAAALDALRRLLDFGPSMFDKFVDMTINGFVGLLDKLAKAIEGFMDRAWKWMKGFSPISYNQGYGFGESGGDYGGARIYNASYSPGGGFGMGGGGWGGGAGGSYDGGGAVGTGTGAGIKGVVDAAAAKYGINPRILYGIIAGESAHGNHYDHGDGGKSYGPFQMYTGGGLGNLIAKDGIDVRDPRSIAKTADWVARFISKGGSLGHWHGFHGLRDWNPRWGNMGYSPEGAAQAPIGANDNTDIVSLGRRLQAMGLNVSEHPLFGGVDPVHHGRGHYEGRAIDVNFGKGVYEATHPVAGPMFDKIAAEARHQGFIAIWRQSGHYNHMHLEAPRGGIGFKPPVASQKPVNIQTDVKLDGRTIAQSMTRHVAKLHEHSTQSPYFNGKAMFAGPDTRFAAG